MDEIKAELREIERAIEANTKQVQRSKTSTRLQWVTLALVLGFFSWVLVDNHYDARREDKIQVEREHQDCLNGIKAREDNRQRLLTIAREIDSQRLTDIINSSYEGSPPPAACD